MTSQRDLDRLLDGFFAEGTNELADRVIDAALEQVNHVHQRRVLRVPLRFVSNTLITRLAVAAVVGVLAIGSAAYLMRSSPYAVGGQSPTPGVLPTDATPAATYVAPHLTGVLGAGRQIHTATRLADGSVLVVGGYDAGDLPLATATLFNPPGIFSPTGSLATARGYHTATLLTDGRVLIAGGGPASWVHPGPYLASAELYDAKTGTFSPTGSMVTPREGHTATLLRDGRVLITGGDDTGNHPTASAELYDPKTGTFSPTGSMATARAFHTATLLADGRVLIAGGDPSGWNFNSLIASAEIYDPSTGTFSATGSLIVGRAWQTATLLPDGRVLIAGGESNGGGDLLVAELYDPNAGTFSPTGSMTEPRTYHQATLLADGRVLMTGGGGDYTNRSFLASAALYDPKTGTFSPTGSMTEPRTYHQATLLLGGRVLITGGYGALAPLASAEIYDPASGTFTAVAPAP
jgi:hypothetical protein